jgi:hypothetical protein
LRLCVGICAFCTALLAWSAAAESAHGATEPAIRPTLLWAAAQFIPSPEMIVMADGAHAGMRWQITPFLYSFGMNPRLSPLRSLVVEPVVRHSGSTELFVSPEYLAAGARTESRWMLRVGLRSYAPILHKGEYLSLSAGGSGFYFQGRGGAAYEVGAYVLAGLFGLQITVSPSGPLRSAIFTLSVRPF